MATSRAGRTHRFVVNVPNPEPKAVTVELGLRDAMLAELDGLSLDLPAAPVEVEEARISLDPCDVGGGRALRRRLKAHSSMDVHVAVTTGPPKSAAVGGAAVLHLSDRRGGEVVGGVLLVCVHPSADEPAGREVGAESPCPVALARPPYAVPSGADPGEPGRQTIPAGTTVDLVVQLANPTKRTLEGVTAYLEHLGSSDAEFAPAAWNIGSLRPGGVFYATWRVSAVGAAHGGFNASVVVESRGRNPTRLTAPFRIRRV